MSASRTTRTQHAADVRASGSGASAGAVAPTDAGSPPPIPADLLETAAEMLRCISHPLRLRIIELLEGGEELTVTEIYEALGVEQAVASQHLTLMRDKGVLENRREGVHVYYRLDDPRAVKVLWCLRGTLGGEVGA